MREAILTKDGLSQIRYSLLVHLRGRHVLRGRLEPERLLLVQILPIRLLGRHATSASRDGCAVSPASIACRWPRLMILLRRLYSVYERSQKILIALLGLAVADFAVQMACNHLATCAYATKVAWDIA